MVGCKRFCYAVSLSHWTGLSPHESIKLIDELVVKRILEQDVGVHLYLQIALEL